MKTNLLNYDLNGLTHHFAEMGEKPFGNGGDEQFTSADAGVHAAVVGRSCQLWRCH